MAYQELELGTAADDGTGDSLRVGGDKINDNFVEFYTALGTGTAISSGISADASIVTLVAPIITEIDSGSTITLDATTDIILDADGGDIFFKDAGTTFGSATNTSGNLIIKSGTTTAATFAGANVTLAGTLGVGAITTTGAFKGADGYTIGNASVADVMTLAATGIVTFKDDILIKNDGTIGSAGAATAMTISSAGIVTFVDDILIKDGGTIGAASAATAITIASSGIVTLVDDLILKDAATIGVTSSTSAIGIASTGIVTFADDILIKDAGTIGNASVAAVMTLASTGIVTFVDDIILKDTATIGVTSSTSAMTIASTGIVTFVDDIILKDAATIGVTSSTSAISIASTGIVTFVDDILIKDVGTIGSASTPAALTIAANGTLTTAAGIELGHASDTTITRASSGEVNIEGNIIYRAGGTDVPVTDGGTGVSTLADGGILLGSGTGAITALAALAKGSVVVGDGATDPVALAVGSNTHVLTADSGEASGLKWAAAAAGGFTLSAEVATTSGTSALFTGIGSGVKVIKIVFELVSFSGSNDEMEIQIGDAGGLETSGYLSMSSTGDNTGYSGTTGYAVGMDAEAADAHSGVIELVLKDATNNTWCMSGVIADDNQTADNYFSGGVKSLSATLDRVSFATENGRTLDGGSIAILTSE